MNKIRKYKNVILIFVMMLVMVNIMYSISLAFKISEYNPKAEGYAFSYNDTSAHFKNGTYEPDGGANNNLFCAEHGDKLRRIDTTYKLVDKITIKGNNAKSYYGKEIKNKLTNGRIAYAIHNAENNHERQKIIWYWLDNWMKNVGQLKDKDKKYIGFSKLQGFTVKDGGIEYKNLSEDSKDVIADAKSYADDIDNDKNTSTTAEIKQNNKDNVSVQIEGEHYKIGPINLTFNPKLSSIYVDNQNGETLEEDQYCFLQNGVEISNENVGQIESKKDFYLLVNRSNMTNIKIKARTKKPKGTTIDATIAFFKSVSGKSYQNLVMVDTKSNTFSSKAASVEISVSLTGNLKIQKVDKDNHQMNLDGAKFMVSNMDTGWVYQNADRSINTTWDDIDWENNPPTSFKPGDTINNLPVGRYQITEVGVPNNYEVNENCEFIVYENGKEVTRGNMETYNDSFAAKEIKVGSGTTVNIQIENKQKYISISGYVWKDGTDGKTTSRNNLYYKTDKEDQLLKGVKVRLMRWRKDANGTIYYDPNKDMEEVKSTWTNDNGEYKFEQVEVDDLGRSFVVFEYNGMKYKSIEAIYNATNGSKAVEHNWRNRNTFDSQYSTISSDNNGNSVANNKNNEKIEYDFGSHTATFKGKDDTYNEKFKVSAETNFGNEHKVDGYYLNNEFKPGTGQTSIDNVNLGLCERDLPDLAVQKDVQNVQVEINGYGHTYNYDRKETLEKQNNEDAFNVGVKFGSKYTEGYELPIYESDSNYINEKDPSKELKVYITYKVRLKNQATTIDSKINSLVDYYDSTYEKNGNCDIRINENINDTDKDGKLNSTIEFSKSDYNDKYKKLNINTKGISIGAGETKCIYIQFGLSRTQIASIINDKSEEGRILKNVVEINSYSSYYKGTTNPYGGIDKDSAPGNAVPGDQSTYEDDTDTAPTLKLEVKEARKLTGKVFLDSTNGTLMTGQIREGDGEYKNGEEGIKDITVTLKPINKDPSYDEYSKKTNENGDFTISGFIPNEYEVIYTWGGQELKNGDKITLDKYKGTAYKERERYTLTGPLWYRQNANKRLTDAIDNYEKRQEIDEKYKSIDHTTESIMNNIQNEKMNSTTPKMSIRIENMRKRRKNNYIIIR